MTNYTGYRAVALILVDLKYSLPGSLDLTMVSAYTLGSWSPALTMSSTCKQGHGQQPWPWLVQAARVMVKDPEHVDHGKIPILFNLYTEVLYVIFLQFIWFSIEQTWFSYLEHQYSSVGKVLLRCPNFRGRGTQCASMWIFFSSELFCLNIFLA